MFVAEGSSNDVEQPPEVLTRLLFVRLRTATLGSCRRNRFVLCNTNYTRNRLVDNVDDRVFNDRRLLSWRLPRCRFCNGFRDRLFGVARFATLLREGLARGFPRFATFLRVARRFFALTIAVSCLPPSNPRDSIPQRFATPLLILRSQRYIKIPRPFPLPPKNGGSPSNSILISDTSVVVVCP